MIEVADPRKYKLFTVEPLDPGGRLTEREQCFLSSFVDPNGVGETVQQRAERFGVLRDGLQLEITFPDGRRGGLRLKAL